MEISAIEIKADNKLQNGKFVKEWRGRITTKTNNAWMSLSIIDPTILNEILLLIEPLLQKELHEGVSSISQELNLLKLNENPDKGLQNSQEYRKI